MSYNALMNDDTEAQLNDNTLESIVNQTKVLTSAQIDVGERPVFIDRTDAAVYVANADSDSVSVIDTATNTVIKTIPVGRNPTSIDRYYDRAVYVANAASDSVSVIDTATNTVVMNITTVGNGPVFIETLEDAVYVANVHSGTVSVINATTNKVIENITVGEYPSFIETFDEGFNTDIVYVANEDSDTVSVINATTNKVIENITTVGNGPVFIGRFEGEFEDTVYVANEFSNHISVINATTNKVIENITVGEQPIFIGTIGGTFGGTDADAIYVANSDNNTVSVIDIATNKVIENITVGEHPKFIETYGDTVYVANEFSNHISVINGTTNKVIKNITVGEHPKFIDRFRDTLYVANYGSNTLSVINPLTNEVVAGVSFDISPFRGGQIICNGLNAPINRYFYVSSGTECTAQPNNGYEFTSWVETFNGNSSRTINASTTSGTPWTSFLDIFGVKSSEPVANLTVNKFGNFTAYFKALPPPVPAEYTVSLFTIVITSLVGSLLIPAAVSWLKSKKQTSRLNSFHLNMVSINKDGLDENDISNLNELNQNISDSYAAGKIINEQYASLRNEVSIAFQEIFKKRIGSIPEQDLETVNKIRNNIIDAYTNGKLSSEHYTNLKNEISNTYQKIFKKRIESLIDPNAEALSKIKNDIRDAYSDGKITELHYSLLNEKISDMFDSKSLH
jgi:YVTN family beta-propeller protein